MMQTCLYPYFMFDCVPRKHSQRICGRAGILPSANTKPGKHLEFDHPAMLKLRTWVLHHLGQGTFHPRLCGNFDQVWSVLYRPAKQNLQIRPEVDPMSKEISKKRIRHLVERAAGLPYTVQMKDDEGKVHAPAVTGGKAACAVVEQWRVPRTLTTLSWNDGSLGRGFVTCREDTLTEEQRVAANKDCLEAQYIYIYIYIYFYLVETRTGKIKWVRGG